MQERQGREMSSGGEGAKANWAGKGICQAGTGQRRAFVHTMFWQLRHAALRWYVVLSTCGHVLARYEHRAFFFVSHALSISSSLV